MSEQNNIPPQNSTMAVISLISGVLGWTVVPIFGALIEWSPGIWPGGKFVKAAGG